MSSYIALLEQIYIRYGHWKHLALTQVVNEYNMNIYILNQAYDSISSIRHT